LIRIVGSEVEDRLDWIALTDALAAGHARPRASPEDVFLRRADDTLLVRSAMIDGLGSLVKAATVFPGNAGRGAPAVNGFVCVFADADGRPEALVDFHLLTRWKTAGDSLLAARRLAPPGVARILVVGAGEAASALRAAYGAGFPNATFAVWNRTPARAEALARGFPGTDVVRDLEGAIASADMVVCATSGGTPVIRGAWLRPGQHVDLVGAFRADMREADDEALRRGRLFVDSRESVAHIGEVADPTARCVIDADAIVADFYEFDAFRREAEDITLFKNGGGAHLDLMAARYILAATDGG
jgi:ornithine cyclodeaminase